MKKYVILLAVTAALAGCGQGMTAVVPDSEPTTEAIRGTLTKPETTEAVSEEAADDGLTLTGIESSTLFYLGGDVSDPEVKSAEVTDAEISEIVDMINSSPRVEGNVNGVNENIWFKNGNTSVYISTNEKFATVHGAKDACVQLDDTQCARLNEIIASKSGAQ